MDITVATAVKNFLENYAEIHGLPSPGRNVNRITQSLTLLPAETSYKSVYRDFIAGLENNSTLKLLKYDIPQVMAPINTLHSNYESKNGFMWHVPTFSEYNARKEEDLLK